MADDIFYSAGCQIQGLVHAVQACQLGKGDWSELQDPRATSMCHPASFSCGCWASNSGLHGRTQNSTI